MLHVVYLLPRAAKDEQLDTNGTLACSILAMNEWMRAESSISWRLDTIRSGPGAGLPDVTFIRSRRGAEELSTVGDISEELRKLGFSQKRKRYVVYAAVDTGGLCGQATVPVPFDAQPVDGKYSAIFLDADPGCHTRGFGVPGSPGQSETIALQEIIHNDGLVPVGAPHTCYLDLGVGLGHVCTGPLGFVTAATDNPMDPEAADVMFPFAIGHRLDEKTIDLGNDDYFRHGISVRLDLINSFYIVEH